MPSSDVIKLVLRDACLKWHDENDDQAIEVFFRSPRPKERSRRAVHMHHWVATDIGATTSLDETRDSAWDVVQELMSTPLVILYEILTGRDRLLPKVPRALDGAPLYNAVDGRGKHRFQVVGGNTMVTTGRVVKDLRLAFARMTAMNVKNPLRPGERFRILCNPSLRSWLEPAQEVAPFSFEVVEFDLLSISDPWFLCREQSLATIKIASPTLVVEMKEDAMGLGAKFIVWLNDAAGSVRVDPKPQFGGFA